MGRGGGGRLPPTDKMALALNTMGLHSHSFIEVLHKFYMMLFSPLIPLVLQIQARSPSTEAGLLAPQPIPAAEPFLTLSPTRIC